MVRGRVKNEKKKTTGCSVGGYGKCEKKDITKILTLKMSEGKVCTKCNQYKYLYEYDKQPLYQNKTGYRSSCKQCNKPIQRRHYQNNKEKYKEAYENFIIRNPNYQSIYYYEKKL